MNAGAFSLLLSPVLAVSRPVVFPETFMGIVRANPGAGLMFDFNIIGLLTGRFDAVAMES